MPLIPCPECQQQISTLAATCPHCGAPRRAESEPERADPEKTAAGVPSKKGRSVAKGCLFAVLAVIGLLILLSIVGPPKDEQRDKAMALCEKAGVRGYRECLDFISTLNKLNGR